MVSSENVLFMAVVFKETEGSLQCREGNVDRGTRDKYRRACKAVAHLMPLVMLGSFRVRQRPEGQEDFSKRGCYSQA